ncbi:hypothetical protein PVAND_017105 [Polypedilum vanderplanki]|uniref:GED domain-containing protein n=1 Tax=Polypedilum vanderplanki TaxID=319348 RepID=A0A9J6BHA1_POLVA|nr:hypothetical protein PVAND_017105 [Polypedilum vanderplanki]
MYCAKKSFKLTSSGGKFIYKEYFSIKVICPTPEVAKNWIDCFEKVGISVRQNSPSLFHFSLNDRNDEETKLANGSPKNTLMKKQVKNKKIKKISASSDVEIVRNLVESYLTINSKDNLSNIDFELVRNLVESYLTIVIKTLRDRIPKTITFLLINKLNEYIEHNLVSYFYENDLVDELMSRSDLDNEKYEKLMSMKNACNEAIKVIDEQIVLLILDSNKGDVVGIVAANTENLAPAVFACFLLGLPVNPLAPIMIESDIVHMFSKTKPKLILCDENCLKIVQNAVNMMKSDAKIITVMEDVENYDSVTKILNRAAEKDFHYPEIDSNSVLAILCSSGSTSLPKGVCKTHKEFIIAADYHDYSLESLIMFQLTTIYWITGFYFLIYSTLYRYTRVITAQPYHPKQFFDILKDYKISMVSSAPFIVSNLMDSGFSMPLEHMRCWLIGGAKVTTKLIENFKPFVPNALLVHTYASTEANLIAFNLNGRKFESSGQPVPNTSIKIVDDDGNALDNFQQGEICVKREVKFAGYFDDLEKTKEAFDGEWFKTGDIGYFDDEGFFYFIDRKKELLKYHNFQVTPSELEAIINEIDGVMSSCVVGVLKENSGNDIIHAFVIVDESSGLTENFILNYVNSKVIEQKKLRGGVHFIGTFPLGKTGKIDKKFLKMKAEEINN